MIGEVHELSHLRVTGNVDDHRMAPVDDHRTRSCVRRGGHRARQPRFPGVVATDQRNDTIRSGLGHRVQLIACAVPSIPTSVELASLNAC